MTAARIGGSARSLMAEARDRTGIGIDDTAIEEALERLLASLNAEADLSDSGAAAMQIRLLRLLCNRLRFRRDLAAHPTIADQVIAGPIILTGGPRTGSTRLHKLLAATGDFKVLPFWQGHCMALRTGDRNEDRSARMAEAEAYIRWIARHAPIAQHNHAYGTVEPEEEVLLLEHFICSTFPSVFAHVPSFMAWWSEQDFIHQARFLKLCLQYLQWQFHDGDPRPWVLKCPIYPGREDVLAETFPGAVFITTNRHPAMTVASTATLVDGYRRAYSNVDRRAMLGRTYVDGLAAGARAQMGLRARRPDLSFLDTGFTALGSTPHQVIEGIYRHVGMTLSHRARTAMAAWQAAQSSYHGGATLTLAEVGVTRDIIEASFADYIDQFGALF